MIKYKNRDTLYTLTQSILAGVMIGIAGTVYLLTDKSLIGVFLFSFGLITIVTRDYYLYTGKIGFVTLDKTGFFNIVLTIIGNFIGTWVVANLMLLTKQGNKLQETANTIYNSKITDSYLSLFILAIFCGMMMYLAIRGYQKSLEDNLSLIYIILPIMIFILCGFEHSIADLFYFNLAKNILKYNLKDFIVILIILIGNGIGAKIIPWSYKIKYK